MKKQILTLTFALCGFLGYSQTIVESANSPSWPATGKVGIGTATPTHKLTVLSNNPLLPRGGYTNPLAHFGLTSDDGLRLQAKGYSESLFGMAIPAFRLQMVTNSTTQDGFIEFSAPATTNTTKAAIAFGYNSIEAMRINQNGKVRIGNGANDIKTPDGYKLFVEEGILTEKVRVAVKTTTDWADYVFAPDYKLMPLNEVEIFTKENKHLPNVPSASQMVNGGLDVAKMDAKLLEKVEELTLYLIEQNKQIEMLKEEIIKLRSKN